MYEQIHRKNQLHIQQQKRLEEGFLDTQNIQLAKIKLDAKNIVKMQESGKITLEIDECTPCLRRIKDDTIVDTKLVVGTPSKKELSDWEFDWSKEEKHGYTVTQLYANGDSRLQGLVATKARKDMYAVEVDIVESAPFNNPHNEKFVRKEYAGVGGHLFAEAVRQSYEEGFDGVVIFTAKTNLINHYKKELGAVQIGSTQKMYIDERSARKLYERYFKK